MSKDEKPKKKPGFMKRLFSSKKFDIEDDQKENKNTDPKKLQRMNTVDPASLSKDSEEKKDTKPKSKDDSDIVKKQSGDTKPKAKPDPPARSKSNGSSASARPKESKKQKVNRERAGGGKRKKKKKKESSVHVDVTKDLSFPCTPEVLLEYHKNKPFLNSSEEWLLVELNEYECLLDSMSIVKIIGKASKFFEVEPDELWEEFFEWVDDIPAYDEVINYDIWQEFRDKKYPM